MEGEEYVNFVAINVVPKAITFEEVQEETLKDEVLQQVASVIERNKWDHLLDKKSPNNSELTIAHDRSYVLRGTRLVMPFALQTRAIDLVHEGHQGLVKSKQLIRTKVWFPGIDKKMKKRIEGCLPCQSTVRNHDDTLAKTTPLPDGPWKSLSADFYGPLPTGEYLIVIIDDYSRFPIVEIVYSTSIG